MNTDHKLKNDEIELRNITSQDSVSNYFLWLKDREINQYLEVRFNLPKNKIELKSYIDSINKSKSPNFDKFIYSLGIREVGLSTARVLSQNFSTLDELMSANRDLLESIKDIGPIVADNIVNFFSTLSNVRRIKKLILSGIEVNYLKLSANKSISNKSFVITGSFNKISRREIEEIIISNGGKVSSSISRKTEFLICGEHPGSKLDKAKKNGTTILTEEKFFKLL